MLSSLRRHTPTLLRHGSQTSRHVTAAAAGASALWSAAEIPAAATASQQPPRRWQHSSSSVNADEISHFNALAATWWDPHGSSRALHLMNPLRHDFINACRSSSQLSSSSTLSPEDTTTTTNQQQQPQSPEKLSYLDVGCGGGIFAESAARLPSTQSVTAIDAAPVIISVARAHAAKDPALSSDKLQYINANIETFSSTPEKFDVISLFEVIEHVDNPAAFLDTCGSLVKPGGWLVLSTIARTWTSWFTTNLVAEDILGIVPKGTHDWNKYINEDELRNHFFKSQKTGGWDIDSLKVMGVVYVPGLGWKEVTGSEKIGNYFFGIQKKL